MTLTVPFSKTLEALADAKAKGQVVYSMTRKDGSWKLDMSDPPLSPAIKTPEIKRSEQETTILSTPQCSSGISQSRPFPARPVKIMESAGRHETGTGAVGVGDTAEKQNASAGNGSGQTNLATDHVLPSMVTCHDCGVERPAGADCAICAPMLRIAAIARERRRAYRLWKSGEGPGPA
jgi:hypothetical protein